jgi:acetyltransferase-like isoleucine patch superfamily enzyme
MDSSVQIDEPVYILPGTSIMPYTSISKDVMISMGVKIAHHTIIKEGCFFSQGTNIGASIVVEQLAYIGIAATLMTGVKRIGRNSLVGAGAVVIRDVPDNVVVAGVPAKVLRNK